jgi:hypothetical protein
MENAKHRRGLDLACERDMIYFGSADGNLYAIS